MVWLRLISFILVSVNPEGFSTTSKRFRSARKYEDVVFSHAMVINSASLLFCGSQCTLIPHCVGFHTINGSCFLYEKSVWDLTLETSLGSLLYEYDQPQTTGIVCEYDLILLQCFGGQKIQIKSGFYGRELPGSEACPSEFISSTDCKANETLVTSALSALCNGLILCEFTRLAEFGDPCLGTYKYVIVHYDCYF